MYGWVIMRKVVSIVCHLFIFNGSNCAFHPFTTISSRTGGGSHITTILLNYSMFSCQWLTNTDPPPSAWDYVMIKETVQGSYDTHSTWLYSAIGKPNTIIKTMKLSIFWNYLALICTADIPYLPPFYLNHKFLFTISLVMIGLMAGACNSIFTRGRSKN